MGAILQVANLSVGFQNRAVLSDVSFDVQRGQCAVLLGPNGVGKTTLFKTVLGFLPKLSGSVFLDGQDSASWSRKTYAKHVAYVPQAHDEAFSFSVFDVVLMGCTAGMGLFATPGAQHEQIARDALDALGVAYLSERSYAALSGGEQQMVLIARALAQQAPLLIMDEPCANLDLGNQAVVLRRIRALVDRGLSVLITSHDPNHAFLLDAQVVCVGKDGVAAVGPAHEVLTSDLLGQIYGARVDVRAFATDGDGTARVSVLGLDDRDGRGSVDG